MKLNLEPCLAPRGLNSGHAQTIWGHLWPSPMLSAIGERVEVVLPDGDQLVGFFLAGKSDTCVSLFHGLSGSTDADYMHRTAQVCQNLGHSVFMFNHRGCGPGAGLASHPYHSGRAEDLSAAIQFAKNRLPSHRHLAIGFSLSGNALLLLLSGHRGDVKPDGGISVNAPIDLESAAFFLKKGLNRIYDFRFVNRCRAEIKERRAVNSSLPEYKISPFSSLHDFDDLYTAPAAGFINREDYYQRCSTKNFIADIDRPTIMFTAKDDPFVDYRNYENAKLSPSIYRHVESVGGHMGYISSRKTPLGTHRWLDYALDAALRVI